MTSVSIQRWLLVIVCASVSACGGGGGGGGSDNNGGGGGPTQSGLMPTAPALGKTLADDAASLRPLREGASWRYRGSYTEYQGATPEVYETTTTQSQVTATSAKEDYSDDGHQGAASYAVNISGGEVSRPLFITFTSNSPGENIKAIELRSPVRVGDQIPLWDRHFADVGVDVDGDKLPDALDTAAYVRVIGEETVTLDDLPPQRAVRVDVTQRARVTLSSTGQPGPVLDSVQQTWYVAGLGIVRQLTRLPSEVSGDTVTDERLVSWNGISEGLGALPQLALTVPADSPLNAGQRLAYDFSMQVFNMQDQALILHPSPTDLFTWNATTLDSGGQIIASREIPGFRPVTVKWAGSSDRVASVEVAGGDALKLTVLDANGALIGSPNGQIISLRGNHVSAQVSNFNVALDGRTLWLMFDRSYYDPAPGNSPSAELVLRPYNLAGQPLGPEMRVGGPEALSFSLSAANGRALITWGSNDGGRRAWHHASATLSGLGMPRTLASGYAFDGTYVEAISLRDHDVLRWLNFPGQVGSTGYGGVLLDAQQQPLRAGPNWADENLADFATGDTPEVAWAGNRLALVRRESLGQYQGSQAVLRWIDVNGQQALAAAPVTRVAGNSATGALRAVLVREDRVLLITGDYQLSSQLFWLNRGRAP